MPGQIKLPEGRDLRVIDLDLIGLRSGGGGPGRQSRQQCHVPYRPAAPRHELGTRERQHRHSGIGRLRGCLVLRLLAREGQPDRNHESGADSRVRQVNLTSQELHDPSDD